MEFWLKGTSRVCRGRHGEVGLVEFGLYRTSPAPTAAAAAADAAGGINCDGKHASDM